MKIDKNIIKELTEYLDEFNLTEIECTEKDKKIKVAKSTLSIIRSLFNCRNQEQGEFYIKFHPLFVSCS